ncbi:MAG TPA: hypothetical protein VEL76_17740 [Gemmataceae bacterium]|nr:hypothetical protein [Gemmataceae bacterium]
MRYEIQFAEAARDKLTALNLSAELLYYLDGRLHEELAVTPTSHLLRVRGEADCLQYSFCESDRSGDHLFVFAVVYGRDEETLIIVDCEYLFEPEV